MATTSAEESARRVTVGPRFSIKPSCALWPGGRSGLMFYSFGRRLANGFTRNGHFAFALDDRECRRQLLGCRTAGTWLAERRLLQVAQELHPDLARANATAMMSGELVTQFILDMTLGRGAPQDWKFGDQVNLRPTRKRANARPEALAPGSALVPQYS